MYHLNKISTKSVWLQLKCLEVKVEEQAKRKYWYVIV
jgi:hypothetical protein